MIETLEELAVLCVDEADMTPALDVAIRELLCECFPGEVRNFSHTRAWHGSGPTYSIVYCEGTRALGHVGVVVRKVACDRRPVMVAGVQNVAVHPERRRTGLSRRVMHQAMEEASRRGIPYGLLFCVPQLERFYHYLGWEKVAATAVMRDEHGTRVSTSDKNITMIRGLAGAPLSPREIDLQGADW